MGVVSLKVVVIFLVNSDLSIGAELSSCDLAVLCLSLSLSNRFVDLSLVSDDVFVWDGDLNGTNEGSVDGALSGQHGLNIATTFT